MSEALIAKLIETRVQAWGEAQDIKVAFENVPFVPADAIYARLRQLPATTTSAFLEGIHKALIGLYQLSIVCPNGKGAGPGRALALTFSSYMPVNLVLTDGAFKVQITSPVTIGPSIQDPESAKTARFTIPCSFSYRADTT
jgi:hypothetical protein